MSADVYPTSQTVQSVGWRQDVGNHWPLIVGFLAMAVPTLLRLSKEVWPLEIGAHGPIVLATGIWLLFHVRAELRELVTKPPYILVVLGILASVALYVFGRPYDLLAIEALGVYGFFLSISLLFLGWRAIRRNIFPFLYLAFLIPVPGWIMDSLTAPLQMFVSKVATAMLGALGYPIARDGIVITIAQYRLLVEDACSGMNSLIGLTAVMLFYIYVIHRSSLRYTALLAASIIPIAVLVNIIRVCALILLTYYYGDAVAQGFLHVTTGVVLFAMALGLTILLDKAFQLVIARRRNRTEAAHA